ncbi:MAG TPA: hypothetical protein PLJ21_04595, partial [Pseudobdellovibrionaceae bacterium]|nr:hypothetical protein [Pseudobdellovibrionaceae bacterium]
MKKIEKLISFVLVFVFGFSPYYPAQARFIPAEGPVVTTPYSSPAIESALQDPLQNTLELLTLVRALNEKVFAEEALLTQELGKELGELEFLNRLTSKKR